MRILLTIIFNLLVSWLGVNGSLEFFRSQKATNSQCTSSSIGKSYCSGTDSCKSNSVTICIGPNIEFNLNCTDTNPYCDYSSGQAHCSGTPPNGCTITSTVDFICTGTGIFPDPLDCKKFYYCSINEDKTLQAQLRTCADRYVFDPDSASFCRYTNNYYCTLPNCKNVSQLKNVLFAFTFYPYNRQYAALCIPNSKPLVFKCEQNYTPNLSTIPITCDWKCKSIGLFPYLYGNTKYYECFYNSQNQLESVLKSCPFGWIFNIDHCQPSPQTTSVATTSVQETTTSLSSINTENQTAISSSSTTSSATANTETQEITASSDLTTN
ncbi:hypothetical protein PVAND_010538 [Polypedilum vanderplanki]|uniref:Chitin-binding type-2 domain-containing protein n=1 Tax=Polypedilum vanderplanki TaxID=319348 RepID=A0A9J6CGW0_POLVA|nr:hypothetical protein PVAND_010538 [Polypedilum vanderplanki]